METRVKLKDRELLSNPNSRYLKLIDPLEVYACQTKYEHFQDWVMLEGWDTWLPAEMFDVIVIELKSCLTPDEISEELVSNCSDPFAAACNKIAAMAPELHKSLGARKQLIENNRIILKKIDDHKKICSEGRGTLTSTLELITNIRKFVEAGSKG